MKKKRVLAVLLALTLVMTTVTSNGIPVSATESAETVESMGEAPTVEAPTDETTESETDEVTETQVQETTTEENGGGGYDRGDRADG